MPRIEARPLLPFAIVALLSAVYLLIRVLDLDAAVTTDEPFWLGRSANFYRALSTGEFQYTYQMAHPGILTMWAGALAFLLRAPEYSDLVTINLLDVHAIDLTLEAVGIDPLQMMVAASISKVVLQGVFFVVSLVFLRLLFGPLVMAIAGAMIVFNPFLSGLDSTLHVDGLFAITSLAAVLAIAYAVRSGHGTYLPWIGAGVLATCAWYTRSVGIVLVLVVLVPLVVSAVRRLVKSERGGFRAALAGPAVSGLLWAGAALFMSILLLPAMWVEPFAVVGEMWGWAGEAAGDGHELPTFFRGEIHAGDPGALFYPVTLLWRLTPIALIGLLLLVGLTTRALKRGIITRHHLQTLGLLVLFAGLVVFVMTTGAKKFDRYILPVYPVTDVLAALGFVLLVSELQRLKWNWSRFALPVVASVVVLGQAAATVSVMPYRLDYFNPLMGGAAAAEETLQLGWGQGADQVIEFIEENREPGQIVTLQTSSAEPVLRYFTSEGIHIASLGLGTPSAWYETEYFVPGIQQWQRDISPSYRLFDEHTPEFEATINGVPYFEVYTPSSYPPPESVTQHADRHQAYGDTMQLVEIVAREHSFDLYWLTLGESAPRSLTLTAEIAPTGEEGVTSPVSATTSWESAEAGLLSKATIQTDELDLQRPLAEYTLAITLRDEVTGDILEATEQSTSSEDMIAQPAIHVSRPEK